MNVDMFSKKIKEQNTVKGTMETKENDMKNKMKKKTPYFKSSSPLWFDDLA